MFECHIHICSKKRVYCHKKSFCWTVMLGLAAQIKHWKFYITSNGNFYPSSNGSSYSIWHIPRTRHPQIFIQFRLWSYGLVERCFIMGYLRLKNLGCDYIPTGIMKLVKRYNSYLNLVDNYVWKNIEFCCKSDSFSSIFLLSSVWTNDPHLGGAMLQN